MEPFTSSRDDDATSEVLRRLRVATTMVFRALFGAPWGLGLEAHFGPAFHVVLDGGCYVGIEGREEQLFLGKGDLVLLPRGERHWIRDQPQTPTASLAEILACVDPSEHGASRQGGDGSVTAMVCGGFTLEGMMDPPIMQLLPRLVHIRGTSGQPAPWLSATLDLLRAENESKEPGGAAVVNRLADVVLTQALRRALAELYPGTGRRCSPLLDPAVAQAIELIHRDPGRRWTVTNLASEVALSRSAFASRFRELVGESPKSYITRTRMAGAATMLRTSDSSIAEVALLAGYASTYSFARAFKRAFAISPGAYRGQDASAAAFESVGVAPADS